MFLVVALEGHSLPPNRHPSGKQSQNRHGKGKEPRTVDPKEQFDYSCR